MTAPHGQPAMSQKIFSLGLSTEAISLYLLCCHLHDAREDLTVPAMGDLWNGSREALARGIADLEERRILSLGLPVEGDQAVYRLNDHRKWRH